MDSPKLESLSVELKMMILKDMDAASILSLISASPSFHRVFYHYHNEILKHSILYSSGISTEVLNDALAAGSLPYPINMNDTGKTTITDDDAAHAAVKCWKGKRFSFSAIGQVGGYACLVPEYPGMVFQLRHGAVVAQLASYINDFISDYAAKARCNPLEDFYVYNNVPKWANPTLKSKEKTSPIRSSEDIRLRKDELIKFQRAFFRFEFYSRVNAHLQSDGEFDREKNPLIQIPPSETEEVACAYGYLWSLQMLALEEMSDDNWVKRHFLMPQTYPVHHSTLRTHDQAMFPTELFLQARFASGIKRVWESVTQPYKERLRLVKDDISKLIASQRQICDPPYNWNCGFMGAVLNGDPQCFTRRCCANQWGLVMAKRELPQKTNTQYSVRHTGRPLEVAMGSSTTPNYSWEHWRNRQIKHKKREVYRSNPKEKAPYRAAEYIIATRRMCGWVFWDNLTLIKLQRWRMTDFKKIDMGGFLVDNDAAD